MYLRSFAEPCLPLGMPFCQSIKHVHLSVGKVGECALCWGKAGVFEQLLAPNPPVNGDRSCVALVLW